MLTRRHACVATCVTQTNYTELVNSIAQEQNLRVQARRARVYSLVLPAVGPLRSCHTVELLHQDACGNSACWGPVPEEGVRERGRAGEQESRRE